MKLKWTKSRLRVCIMMENHVVFTRLYDISRICFNAHETTAPSRGWQWDRNTFTVLFHIQPQHFPNLLQCPRNKRSKSRLTMRSLCIYCYLSYPTSTLSKFTSMSTKQWLQVEVDNEIVMHLLLSLISMIVCAYWSKFGKCLFPMVRFLLNIVHAFHTKSFLFSKLTERAVWIDLDVFRLYPSTTIVFAITFMVNTHLIFQQ